MEKYYFLSILQYSGFFGFFFKFFWGRKIFTPWRPWGLQTATNTDIVSVFGVDRYRNFNLWSHHCSIGSFLVRFHSDGLVGPCHSLEALTYGTTAGSGFLARKHLAFFFCLSYTLTISCIWTDNIGVKCLFEAMSVYTHCLRCLI